MKKVITTVPALLLVVLPFAASAHEVATYKINGAMYQVVIGSLNEPVVVDDKTGIDLTVSKCATSTCAPTMSPDGGMDGPAGAPVTGLDQTLKVTLAAGSQKKTLALVPQYGQDGKYTTPFYPTVATTLSYEFTGTIAGTPVDLTYTCIPEGTPNAPENMTPVKLSNSVTQMSTSGGFGCPVEKADLGFPERSASVADLSSEAGTANGMADVGLGVGVVALVFGGFALMRSKKS
jgi:hypothetical protein